MPPVPRGRGDVLTDSALRSGASFTSSDWTRREMDEKDEDLGEFLSFNPEKRKNCENLEKLFTFKNF